MGLKVMLIKGEEAFFEGSITHNLNVMAKEAGVYEALWRPYLLKKYFPVGSRLEDELEFEQSCIVLAKDILPSLELGIEKLLKRPTLYVKFEGKNAFYTDFINFILEYLQACQEHPDALIKTLR